MPEKVSCIPGLRREVLRKSYSDSGIIPEAVDTACECVEWLEKHKSKTLTEHGHSLGILATVIACQEGKTRDEQISDLKKKALLLVEKYGDQIITVMTPELRESLNLQIKNEE